MRFLLLIILAFCSMTMNSCYNDSEENLYGTACDTIAVSYANDIVGIMQNRCYSCHGDNNTTSVYEFEGHADLVKMINGGRFLGAIKHESGFTAMPLGGAKIPECEISLIEAWINQGKLNN